MGGIGGWGRDCRHPGTPRGYHLLGSVRVSGIEAGDADDLSNPNNPTTSFYVWVDGENRTPGARYVQGLDPIAEPDDVFSHEMVGRFAILDIDSDAELDGVELTFEVVVEDVEGQLVGDALTLWAYPHPYNHLDLISRFHSSFHHPHIGGPRG